MESSGEKTSKQHTLVEYKGGEKFRELRSNEIFPVSNGSRFTFRELFQTVFLPDGFPESVSKDYVEYQIWDSLQALFSSVSGSLATKAVLEGIGVGDTTATALSATFTWLLRDGASMIGRIIFAAVKGRELDANCKQWRLFADILNDVSMGLEIVAPIILPSYTKLVFCIAGVGKSIVGVAGGATRAALMHHQALQGNYADVAAKDGSQETLINLTALFLSFALLPIITQTTMITWFSFLILTFLHVYANYRAVTALEINRLNRHRLNIIIENHRSTGKVLNVAEANRHEPVFCLKRGSENAKFGYKIHIAPSSTVLETPENHFCKDQKYWIQLRKQGKCSVGYIFLSRMANAQDTIKAYYELVTHALNGETGDLKVKSNDSDAFVRALQAAGWSTDDHLLVAGEYRIELKKTE